MNKIIAILNSHERLQSILASMESELPLPSRHYSDIKTLIDDINSRIISPGDIALFIVTGTSEENDPALYRKTMQLLQQFKKHSKLATVPVFFLGFGGCAELRNSCEEFVTDYLDLPAKKSELVARIRDLCTGMGSEHRVSPITIAREPPETGSEPVKKTAPAGISAARAESERRLATVMFADISGFTAMSEKMDPEEVTRVMNRRFTRWKRVIKEHGGHIDKFIGDCVMVLFGVPKALENAPLMAVNTAIEMRNALYRSTGITISPFRWISTSA